MSDLARLTAAIADHYTVEREVGRGGMATVYLARDVKHDRQVALKVLDPELGAVLGAERFLAEIKVTANLQHPNLLPLFDSGEAGGLLYYVMPFVEGESLRAKLDREKQLPVDEAIRISVAIASALDYAHGHGVIHRDLKPENILMQAGQPVVADFGIALAVSNAGGNRITQTGLSLGTPQYMSPEQATGDRVIDGRSDIYSLAAMTYEMLTGEPPHSGSTSQAVIARVLTEKPRSVRSTRPSVPEYVEWTLERGLAKLPADRWATAHEFAEALQGHSVRAPGAGAAAAGEAWGVARSPRIGVRARLRDPVVVALGLVSLAALAVATVLARRPAPPPAHAVRFLVTTSDSERPVDAAPWPAAISPDGNIVVYTVQQASGIQVLYSLRTDQLTPRPIPGSVGATQVLFSPDGQWIAFESNGKLRKVRLDGTSPIAITDGGSDNGADWTTGDEIVLGAEGRMHGLSHVSAAGGERVALTRPDSTKGETDHLWPIALADGKTIVFVLYRGSNATSRLAFTSLADGKVTPLDVRGIRPLAVIDESLLYVQDDGAVMAVNIDARRQRVTGKPSPVLDPVVIPAGTNGNSGIFVSRGGALVTSLGNPTSQLVWLDRDGAAHPIIREARAYSHPRLSPDGRRVTLAIADAQGSDIWLFDLTTSTLSKLTSVESASSPAWTPDSKSIVYIANGPDGKAYFWSQAADGGAPPQKLAEPVGTPAEVEMSPDGRSLVYGTWNENSWDIFTSGLDSTRASRAFVATKATEAQATFSPDGRWVALSSDESGRDEVYIRSYPDPGARLQVSAGGGGTPRWSPDGKFLYYKAGDSMLAAKLAIGPTIQVLSRDTVVRRLPPGPGSLFDEGFTMAHDGSRFLMLTSVHADLQLVVVPNWIVELRQRLAANTKK